MNILIVDDELDSIDATEAYVKKYKSFDKCITCSNALEAIEQANKINFDIALLDIEMPVMNGLELAERLLNISPHIQIAFLTAYNHYAAEAFEVNAIDYVLKPIRQERLFKALDKLCVKKVEKSHSELERNEFCINMFGKFNVSMQGKLVKWRRQKSFELFAYLLENKGNPIRKEVLCELFWPDMDTKKALINLQVAINSIRKTMDDGTGKINIEYSSNKYTLHVKDIFIDVNEFECLLKKSKHSKDSTYIKQAIELYLGDYLEEEGWLWAEAKKIMLRKKYLSALQSIKKNV